MTDKILDAFEKYFWQPMKDHLFITLNVLMLIILIAMLLGEK